MDITPLIPKSSQVIQSYGADGFKVSGEVLSSGAIVTINESFEWVDKDVMSLSRADFSFIKDLPEKIEVLLIGTGEKMQFIDKDVKNFLIQTYSLTPEVMDTGAAARTYNVLISEGRHVCAALLPYK